MSNGYNAAAYMQGARRDREDDDAAETSGSRVEDRRYKQDLLG